MIGDNRQAWIRNLPVLGVLWLLGALSDRLWFTLDHSVPAWDQADYLSGALNYWQALQTPDWFSFDWWNRLWLLSSKIPPLVYLLTVPILNIFGPGPDQSTLVNLFFNAILLLSVYTLGTYLFTVPVGLLAAGFCMLMPGLYRLRLDYLIDYPLVAMVTLAFLCLTLWRGESQQRQGANWRTEQPRAAEDADATSSDPGDLENQPNEERLDIGTSGDASTVHQPEEQQESATEAQEPQSSPGVVIAIPTAEEITVSASELERSEIEAEIEVESVPGEDADFSPFPLLQSKLQLLDSKIQTLKSKLQTFFPLLPLLSPWLLSIATGIALGSALMTKQTALLFLLIPLLWTVGEALWKRACRRLLQWLLAIACSIPVFYPWYRTNWLLLLTSGKRATVDSALAEGDPSLLSLNAWIYYLKALPNLISLPLLLVGLLGLLCFWRRSRVSSLWAGDYSPKPKSYQQQFFTATQRSLAWLLIFWIGGYLLSTLNPNKDPRYVAPFLPVLSIVLAYGLTLLPRRWKYFQWSVVGLAVVLMLANLFSRSGNSQAVRWKVPLPHRDVAAEIIRTDPYLQSTVGVLPSTPQINQHNINYYGLLQNFQVYGRQVGTRQSHVYQDGRSLSWYLTKTGDQGAIRNPQAQTALVQQIEQSEDFALQKSWPLPDNSSLNLYRRRFPLLEVQPVKKDLADQAAEEQKSEIQKTESQKPEALDNIGNTLKLYRQVNTPAPITLLSPVSLEQISLPEQAPPGQPIPVTYQWVGSWNALRSGLVLLTWHRQQESPETKADRWFHDHSIGMGFLKASPIANTSMSQFQVLERTAMLLPGSLSAGTYTLDAMYLNPTTGQTLQIATPTVSLRITPDAAPTKAPALDLVTQLRNLAATLPQGTKALERIFDEIARINQYDTTQDYVNQTRQIMEYRLQQEPKNQIFAYTLAFTQVLQRRVAPAITDFQQVTQLDPQNPYAYGYLAFVNLYDFRPNVAQAAIDTALRLNPNLPELHGLRAIALLMQGKLQQSWQECKRADLCRSS